MANIALLIAGIVFMIVAVMHALRLVFKIEVRVANFVIPVWLSIFGTIFPLLLAIWLFKCIK